jgi:hypothetical protein
MTNNESASRGRGREPNHDRTVGPAVLGRSPRLPSRPHRSCHARCAQHPMPGNESMSAARARPGNGRDSNKESNATNAKDGCGLRGSSGRVGNPQATTGAPTEWDDEKAAYVATHGVPTMRPMKLPTMRPTEGVIVKGCQRCGVVWFYHGEKFPGENRTARKRCQFFFLPAQKRQHKKGAAIAQGVHGGTHSDRQGLPELFGSTTEENFQDRKQ